MTDLENQKNVTQTDELHTDESTLYREQQVPVIHGVSVPTLFERVIRRNRKKMSPNTIRRPSYLRYIEYP